MKKLLTLTLALVMVLSLLTGCGASSKNVMTDSAAPRQEAAMEVPAAGEMFYGTADSISDTLTGADQKLVKTLRMDAETEDLEALLPQITQKIADLGGYIENQEVYNGSNYASYRSRNANLTVRIPVANLNQFTEGVKGVSNVVSYSESTENVTLTYVSTESRVKALEVEQERLLELLAKAENMADLLEIEARLTDVRYELERYTSQLRVLDNQVDYATIHLSIHQVKVYTEVEEQTVWQRIGSGFKENLRDIGENAVDFFVWVVTYSPQLLLWAVIAAVVITLIKKKRQKRRVSTAPTDNDAQT
jgi:hypothetical protein